MNFVDIVYLENYDLENWGPIEQKNGAACFDLRAAITDSIVINDCMVTFVPLGIKVGLSKKQCMEIYPRSGLGGKGLTMANSVGQIDPDYRGEIIVPLIHCENNGNMRISPGDRVVQAKIVPVTRTIFTQCKEEELSNTDRGEGGFGSTGKQ